MEWIHLSSCFLLKIIRWKFHISTFNLWCWLVLWYMCIRVCLGAAWDSSVCAAFTFPIWFLPAFLNLLSSHLKHNTPENYATPEPEKQKTFVSLENVSHFPRQIESNKRVKHEKAKKKKREYFLPIFCWCFSCCLCCGCSLHVVPHPPSTTLSKHTTHITLCLRIWMLQGESSRDRNSMRKVWVLLAYLRIISEFCLIIKHVKKRIPMICWM